MNTMTKLAPVNGIPVADVHALVAAISEDPKVGMTRWKVANSWRGGTKSRAQIDSFGMSGETVARPFAFDVDEPTELGGTNQFANPQEYLLGAMNACMTVGFTALCALNGLEIEELTIETEGDIDLRGFLGLDASVSPGYDRLQTTLTVKGAATAEQFQQIFAVMLATSPNFHNITRPIEVAPRLVVV